MRKILTSGLLAMTMVIASPVPSVYADSAVESLSPELRALLSKEMLALQDGMKAIFPAYISGDLTTIAKIAHEIKHSYIMKQSITSAQKHELKSKLPKAFIQSDKQFHKYAGMLEHVAKEKHLELVGFYYSKLTESCVGCHSEYATHRFPDLKEKSHGHDKGDHH